MGDRSQTHNVEIGGLHKSSFLSLQCKERKLFAGISDLPNQSLFEAGAINLGIKGDLHAKNE